MYVNDATLTDYLHHLGTYKHPKGHVHTHLPLHMQTFIYLPNAHVLMHPHMKVCYSVHLSLAYTLYRQWHYFARINNCTGMFYKRGQCLCSQRFYKARHRKLAQTTSLNVSLSVSLQTFIHTTSYKPQTNPSICISTVITTETIPRAAAVTSAELG